MTKVQQVAKIWADWNERKISGDTAMGQVGKLFPKASLKEWRNRFPVDFKNTKEEKP